MLWILVLGVCFFALLFEGRRTIVVNLLFRHWVQVMQFGCASLRLRRQLSILLLIPALLAIVLEVFVLLKSNSFFLALLCLLHLLLLLLWRW